VKPAGRAEVFDFTEPKTHWGVVEGFVVHNSEILLRPNQFCNLTAACARPEDTFEDLKEKVRISTILGTIQATQTNFSYISPIWKKNCEEERLLGVSIPGAMDHPVLQNVSEEAKQWLDELSEYVVEVNKEWAKLLGINPAAASRCQKPAGNSGELYNVSSGLHTRFGPYYARRVRADEKDPLAQVMKQQGFHCEDDVMQKGSLVFSFPVKSPENSVFRDDRTAIEQLEYWLMWKRHWTDHNPSVTVYVKEHEWMEVGAWVWKHFDEVCGISFLPHSDHIYQQAPYEEISREDYEKLVKATPKFIDYELLNEMETSDHTTGMQEPACSAGGCDFI
jgi:ribonucleoside-diphosphate reductase alpha chain